MGDTEHGREREQQLLDAARNLLDHMGVVPYGGNHFLQSAVLELRAAVSKYKGIM